MKNTNNYLNNQSNNSTELLKLEDITTINEATVYLSITDASNKQLSLDEITVAQKTHGQNGFKNAYQNYVQMIIQSIDEAYELLLPLLFFNKNRNELIKKAKSIVSQIKSIKTDIKYTLNIHPKAVFVGFYLLKNYLLPNLKTPKVGGVK